MEITIERAEDMSPPKEISPASPLGLIPIDSIFTPIRRVNFHVEDTRVGQVTDYDKLTLEVWTNGSIKADEAASLAAKIMSSI